MEDKTPTVIEPTEEHVGQINRHAHRVLTGLLEEYEGKSGDASYEAEFVGDLYARLIVAHYMGYFTDKLADEAAQTAHDLMLASGVVMEEVTEEEETP